MDDLFDISQYSSLDEHAPIMEKRKMYADQYRALAAYLSVTLPDSRERSIALTDLQRSFQMVMSML